MLPTLDVSKDHDWTPERITELRARLGWTQKKFGQYLYDYDPATAQTYVSRLESGNRKPGAAARKTLERRETQTEQESSSSLT